MQESKTDRQIIQAQTSSLYKHINHETQVKILVAICLKCGIRNKLDEDVIPLIKQVIIEKFTSLKADELIIACSMNMYNEFEKKIEHFHSLTPDFICNVLLEYYKHRQKLLAKITKVDPYQPLTDEQKQSNLNYMLTDLLQKFEQFKIQGDIEIQINKPVFDYLWENRLLRFSKIKADDYKKRATEQHIKNLTENPIALKSPSAQKELKHLAVGITCLESEGSISWLSRMFSINDWFKQLIYEKKELKDLLKNAPGEQFFEKK